MYSLPRCPSATLLHKSSVHSPSIRRMIMAMICCPAISPMGMSLSGRASFLGNKEFISVRNLPYCTLILSVRTYPLRSPISWDFNSTKRFLIIHISTTSVHGLRDIKLLQTLLLLEYKSFSVVSELGWICLEPSQAQAPCSISLTSKVVYLYFSLSISMP